MPIIISEEEIARAQMVDTELANEIRNPSSSLLLRKIRLPGNLDLYCDCRLLTTRPYILLSLRRKIFDMFHCLSHPSGRSIKKQIA